MGQAESVELAGRVGLVDRAVLAALAGRGGQAERAVLAALPVPVDRAGPVARVVSAAPVVRVDLVVSAALVVRVDLVGLAVLVALAEPGA